MGTSILVRPVAVLREFYYTEYRNRLVFPTILRGESEAYAHELPNSDNTNCNCLLQKIEVRVGHFYIKKAFIAGAKLRKHKFGL